jgi:probable F420-dependent oxidoreductase
MKIGVSMFITADSIDVATLAHRAEQLGFESLWVPEHTVIPVGAQTPWPGSPEGIMPPEYSKMVDPFVALARASSVTNTIKLGTGICLIPERNPLLLAKEVATLDHLSSGRFLFGIGNGWLREETELFGIPFKDRVGYTRESILAMKELWGHAESEYHGRSIDFPPVRSLPKPAQKPHPPILLGGNAKNVFRRIVAWGDGWMPNRITPDRLKAGRLELDRLAEEAGRDPSGLEISVFGQPADRELLRDFEEAGAVRGVVRLDSGPEDEAIAQLEETSRKVLL